ncbi:MAG: AAA family ATPase [Acidimicrobiales bacterium]
MTISVTADAATIAEFKERYDAIHQNVATVIRGKDGVIRLALTAMLAEGHVLIDDVPGTGKTSLAKAIARSVQGEFNRVQFTPDLLPTDVTGSTIYHGGNFQFHPGGVFANVVLADEINRASPKTQAALLQVMEERLVTVDGEDHPVPRPFVVLATQNPVEFDGTYHLPEAQIDRFMLRISMDYPDFASEVQIITDRLSNATPEQLTPVISIDEFGWMINTAQMVHVAEPLKEYVVTVVAATRNMEELRLGVSPRGSLALIRAAQAWAAGRGRHFVTADDVADLAPFVLGHRMLMTPEAELQGLTTADLVRRTLDAVPVPASR